MTLGQAVYMATVVQGYESWSEHYKDMPLSAYQFDDAPESSLSPPAAAAAAAARTGSEKNPD